eukprot:Filipodium_phascolosomae@DN283_c0_g1_i1.p1
MHEATRLDILKQRMASRFEVDQRAALFGSRGVSGANGGANGGGANGGSGGGGKAYSNSVLEQQNDESINELETKVSSLKHIAMGISREAKDSNNLLDSMGGQFDHARSLLANTLKRLNVLVTKAGPGHMWIIALFVIVLFLIMYYLYKFSR